jgi:hypothetical protein
MVAVSKETTFSFNNAVYVNSGGLILGLQQYTEIAGPVGHLWASRKN